MTWMCIKRITYDSAAKTASSESYLESRRVDSGYLCLGIACGYASTTHILFRHEAVTARVGADGTVEFLDSGGKSLTGARIPPVKDGRECFMEVCCKEEDGGIWIRFPRYTWYDNYPYCDGESDRWDATVKGYEPPIVFDLTTQSCAIQKDV
jgi:hypothetical protein